MAVHGMDVFFHPGVLEDYFGNAAILPGKSQNKKTKKIPNLKLFSKFFNITAHKLPA